MTARVLTAMAWALFAVSLGGTLAWAFLSALEAVRVVP